jgi:hypothetical protein
MFVLATKEYIIYTLHFSVSHVHGRIFTIPEGVGNVFAAAMLQSPRHPLEHTFSMTSFLDRHQI